jgi:hypothetical protein
MEKAPKNHHCSGKIHGKSSNDSRAMWKLPDGPWVIMGITREQFSNHQKIRKHPVQPLPICLKLMNSPFISPCYTCVYIYINYLIYTIYQPTICWYHCITNIPHPILSHENPSIKFPLDWIQNPIRIPLIHRSNTKYQQLVQNLCQLFLANGQIKQ